MTAPRYSNAPDNDQIPVESLNALNDRLIELMAARAEALRLATTHSQDTTANTRLRHYIGFATLAGVGLGMTAGAVIGAMGDHHIDDHAPQFFAGAVTTFIALMGVGFTWMNHHFYGTETDHMARARALDEHIYDLTHTHPNFDRVRMHHFDDTPHKRAKPQPH